MKEILAPVIDSVIGVVLVANTPAYLFKHLRRVLADISKEVPLDRLVGELQKELSCPSQDVFHIAYSYALFILMTYKPYPEVQRELDWIGASRHRWMEDLVMRYKQTAKVSTEISVEGEPPTPLSVNPKDRFANGTNNIIPPIEIN